MPPAQRARMEETMRARAGKVNTTTRRSCVTKEDIARSDLMRNDRSNCKRKVIAQNARHLEVDEVCTAPEASTSHFKFDATSAESYTGVIDMARAEGGKVHIDMSGRWIGATCEKGVHD
jgi:hypothetical protein